MASLCFFVQLPDRTPILAKGVFLCTSSGRSLFWNHSPSEWFSKYKKGPAPQAYLLRGRTFRDREMCYFYFRSRERVMFFSSTVPSVAKALTAVPNFR